MNFAPKKCRVCKALGVGPNAVKLWLFENWYYCKTHWIDHSHWDANRSAAVTYIEHMDKGVLRDKKRKAKYKSPKWEGYILELCGMAGFALEHDDRKTFIHYASRAILAWGLKETQDVPDQNTRR